MRAPRKLVGAVAAAALLTAACSDDEDKVTTAPEQPEQTEDEPEPEPEPEPTEEPDPEPEPTEEPTEEPEPEPTEEPTDDDTDDTNGGDAGGATVEYELGEVTAPGTTLSVGDSAYTIDGARDGDGTLHSRVIVKATVVEVGQFEENIFEDADNAEEFEGYYPWYVVMEYEYIAFEDEPETRLPTIGAYDSTNTQVSGVRGSAFMRIPVEGCEEASSPSAEVGATGMQCDTYMVPEGDEITSVEWAGSIVTEDEGGADYRSEPVVWEVGN